MNRSDYQREVRAPFGGGSRLTLPHCALTDGAPANKSQSEPTGINRIQSASTRISRKQKESIGISVNHQEPIGYDRNHATTLFVFFCVRRI
eukprot:4688659-Pyramimonas_sp.AAC.1